MNAQHKMFSVITTEMAKLGIYDVDGPKRAVVMAASYKTLHIKPPVTSVDGIAGFRVEEQECLNLRIMIDGSPPVYVLERTMPISKTTYNLSEVLESSDHGFWDGIDKIEKNSEELALAMRKYVRALGRMESATAAGMAATAESNNKIIIKEERKARKAIEKWGKVFSDFDVDRSEDIYDDEKAAYTLVNKNDEFGKKVASQVEVYMNLISNDAEESALVAA